MIREHGSNLAADNAFGYSAEMTFEAPNTPITLTADQLAEVALSTIRATIGHVKYQYLSGPITGGQKYLDWYRTIGRSIFSDPDYKRARKQAVIDPNIADVQAAAKAEREAGHNTIEPGSFEADFEQWGQKEFLHFWEKVIKQHIGCVRFMDGWAYSAGCACEYLCALRCNLQTCDMQGQALGPDRALPLLDAALADIWAQLDPEHRPNAPLIELHDKILDYREKIGRFAG